MKAPSLLDQFLRLQAKLRDIENPHEEPEVVEHKMQEVRAFFSQINTAKDAGTAASLYTDKFFRQSGLSVEFRRALLDFLLDHFYKSSSLIEDTYNLWRNIRGEL